MKSKNEVYVEVSSKKVAKKLKKVLDMFGESIFNNPNPEDEYHKGKDGWAYGYHEGYWQGINVNSISEKNNSTITKVTVKELKQILFREHAKKGDVVIVDNGECGSRLVLELTGNNIASFEHSKSFDLKSRELDNDVDSITGGNFIRYATEEEKELLYPKKELEKGKWYWGNGEKLIFVIAFNSDGDLACGYGIGENGRWYDDDGYFSWTTYDLKEATKEEVESALRKEAEKRYGNDWKTVKIKEHADGFMGAENTGDYTPSFSSYNNRIWNNNGVLFHDGKWAEKLESLEVDLEFVINGDDIRACLDRVKINALDVSVVEKLSDLVEKHYSTMSNKPPVVNDARQLAEKLRKLL